MIDDSGRHKAFCQESLERFDRFFQTDSAAYLDEIFGDQALVVDVTATVKDVSQFRTKLWQHARQFGFYRLMLYCLTRQVAPTLIVETGVLHGFTSMLILAALDRNRKGRLLSIDQPSYFESGPANQDGFTDVLPQGRQPGWIVPERLKGAWELKLGKSGDLLGLAVAEGLDVFLHDSDHTYENMRDEFETVWPKLRAGGFLIADNIDVNTSFFDFANRVGRQVLVFPADPENDGYHRPIRFGVLRK